MSYEILAQWVFVEMPRDGRPLRCRAGFRYADRPVTRAGYIYSLLS